ncbi:MAG: FG-GAP repeat protein, partial [Rhodothermales bacterium]|nr:FG-GAP repeat protein [Rhodothermales bacterium]
MARLSLGWALIVFVSVGLTDDFAAAQSQQKVLAPDGKQNDFFGMSVSLLGDLAVVGASAANGATYVLRSQCLSGQPCAWQEEQKLVSGVTSDRFGSAVAASGAWIVVGAPEDANEKGVGAGAAYVFGRRGAAWNLEQKLIPGDAEAYDAFGHTVAIDGNLMVIGSPMGDTGGMAPVMSGSAYVYRYDGSAWVEEFELLPSDGAMADRFGNAIAMQGDRVVVGAPRNDNPKGANAGAVYIFRQSECSASEPCSWVLEQKILAADGEANDFFGAAVAIKEDRLIAGAWRDDHSGGVDAGSAYTFRHGGSKWTQEQKLMAHDADAGDQFGGHVAISGGRAIVAASADSNENGERSGSAYAFRLDGAGWVQEYKLMASD